MEIWIFFLDYMITPPKNPLPADIKSHPIERKRFMKYSLAQQAFGFSILNWGSNCLCPKLKPPPFF